MKIFGCLARGLASLACLEKDSISLAGYLSTDKRKIVLAIWKVLRIFENQALCYSVFQPWQHYALKKDRCEAGPQPADIFEGAKWL